MRKFWTGFVIAAVAIAAAEFAYVRFGFVNPSADVAENPIEKGIAMPETLPG